MSDVSAELPLLILFGSQSGNAEDLSAKAAKEAKSFGIQATVKGMDEIKLEELPNFNRILIYCSTWGEGEMPDNAEDLWQEAQGDSLPSLSKCHFAVCSLGDSSYEFFCQSGIDWDLWFEKQGANRVVQRLDCDVEYDEPAAVFTTEALSHFAAVDSSGNYDASKVGQEKDNQELEDTIEEKSEESDITVSTGEGIESFLNSGDRSLSILFGSQSGNSEALASKIAKQAKSYGLDGKIYDMDGFDFNSISSMKRVLIICSTWGEGEMPDNAEELWQFAISDSASKLDGVFYSVCALGDSSYEFFCQSGKDWDAQFEKLGATRLVDRLDCDVDYDTPAEMWSLDILPALAAVDSTGMYHEEMIDEINAFVMGESAGAEGEDGFILPSDITESIQSQITIFRYDPISASTGSDTWLCALPRNMSILDVLRELKHTQDGSLTFRDGNPDDPNTALLVNGKMILPGLVRLDSIAPIRDNSLKIRIEPLSGFDVIRDLVIDPWVSEVKRESSKPWMIAATREGENTIQGVVGTMDPQVATELHVITDYNSEIILYSSSDAVPFSKEYLGPAVISKLWARRKDPRTSNTRINQIDNLLGSSKGIIAETDLSSIRRHSENGPRIAESLLEAKNSALTKNGFNGRHGKHVWWYSWSVKSSGRVNDTVIYRQALGPGGLLRNLFSGVTARMIFGFTRTGGNMFNGRLGMIAPPAGIGKMPKQLNNSVNNHHQVVAIFNELDGRF